MADSIPTRLAAAMTAGKEFRDSQRIHYRPDRWDGIVCSLLLEAGYQPVWRGEPLPPCQQALAMQQATDRSGSRAEPI